LLPPDLVIWAEEPPPNFNNLWDIAATDGRFRQRRHPVNMEQYLGNSRAMSDLKRKAVCVAAAVFLAAGAAAPSEGGAQQESVNPGSSALPVEVAGVISHEHDPGVLTSLIHPRG
jgi:hypothetical protein